MRFSSFMAWPLLLIAVFAWSGVLYFTYAIDALEASYATTVQDEHQSSVQQQSIVRMHALVQETSDERARLDAILNIDVPAIANLLKSVGSAGVPVKLSGALPEIAPPAAARGPEVSAVGFALEADGSFSALMHTLQLLEDLPLASTVSRVDIQRVGDPNGKTTSWHMNVYVKVLTAISS
jgi:hypothetical protein